MASSVQAAGRAPHEPVYDVKKEFFKTIVFTDKNEKLSELWKMEAEILLAHGADINFQPKGVYESGWTPLHIACAKGNVELVKWLLERGANVHSLDIEDNTPLHIAAMMASFDVIPLLIEKGADINAQNIFSATPLLWARKGLDDSKYSNRRQVPEIKQLFEKTINLLISLRATI